MCRILSLGWIVGMLLIAGVTLGSNAAFAQGPTSASCAAVQNFSEIYTFSLQDGQGDRATGTINFLAPAPLPGGFHHNVALQINGGATQYFDIVADLCTNNGSGNAVFNLHPENGEGGVDLTDGDKWTFSLPAPLSTSYAVTDTTGTQFQHPTTPGWTGSAACTPSAGNSNCPSGANSPSKL